MCLWLVVVVIIGSFNACKISAEFQRFEQPTKGDGTLRFLVVGDWERKGDYNQSQVAFQMGRIGEELDIDFVVSTGDNFYDNGLKGRMIQTFWILLPIFTRPRACKNNGLVGTMITGGDAVAQLSPFLRKIDTRWLCLRSFLVNAEIAEFFFVDTTPFVNDYFTNPEDHKYDWRGVSPVNTYTANLLKDLEKALKESRATWKIVVGHHAIRSPNPIFDKWSRVEGMEGDVNTTNDQGLKFFYDGQGFMSVQLTLSEVETVFYDVFGRVLHRWTMSKQHLLSAM
ncbi:hypothetical protein DH2020_018913 [Rehmannia glutinosa]|uniref:Calcineurin-like phosphoesterase domain-containing protein n=1 Tax=Rehmannia glutinosa TaxID=99300 RepID=A0ABR0WM72_REHGL